MSDITTTSNNQFTVFNSLPGAFLLLSSELFIEAVSDDYLEATLATRQHLIGKYIFEVFPDNPSVPTVTGAFNFRASFQKVLTTGKRHELAQQRYDVPDPHNPGHFVERYWLPCNTPVLDEQGQVVQIIHSVVNVTESVQAERILQQSQENERAAQAQVNLQRHQLENILMQAPAMICIFQGPEHVFKLVNPSYQQLVGERSIVGKPIAQAMPELVGQPIFGLLDNVYHTGQTYYAHEMMVQLDHNNSGKELGQNYYNFIYQATRNLDGDVDGIMVFAYEVTSQVKARQLVEESRKEVQSLNEELQAINEELQVSNEELITTNLKLQTTQRALQELNNTLEILVADRTYALEKALDETVQQREQLREQQILLQQILGQVPASIATLVGPDHHFNFFNDAFQALSGNRTELGLMAANVFPEVKEQGFIQLLDQVYTTGNPYKGYATPIQLYNQNTEKPEQHYVDFIYQPLHNGIGQVQGILAFIVDVTEKVHAQQRAEALQAEVLDEIQQQAQLRETFYQVFEETPAAICIHRGPEHRFDYVNPAYQQFFPERKLLNRPLAEALPETLSGGFVALHDKVYQTGETFFGHELPLHLNRPDGSKQEYYFTFTYQAFREKGQIVGTTTFAYDVTEQVLARQEADQQRQLLHQLFMEAPAPIVILDGAEMVFQLVNPAYQKIFPGRKLLGKPLVDALPEIAQSPIHDIIKNVYDTGKTFVAHDMPLLLSRREGEPLEEIYWTFTYQARHNRQGAVDGVMVFAHEVTDQVKARQVVEKNEDQAKALAAELAKANEELWVANQEIQSSYEELGIANQQLKRTNVDLDNFIYTASHDLKAPILNIEGLMEALKDHITPDNLKSKTVQYTIQLIMDSVQRFKRTIDHLTEITKLQKENNTEKTDIDLSTIIADVQLDLAVAIREAQAQFQIEVSDCPTIHFSVKNLRSIIYNLISNAIKYRSPLRPVLVRIHCYNTADYQIISVSDNGLGMDLSGKHKLFTMFQRLHSHVEGTGIGLYMVKKIIENAGGKIEVQSKVDEGTTFKVYFRRFTY